MKQKPNRKNFHKEKIFTLEQNKRDFEYTVAHRPKEKTGHEVKAAEEAKGHGPCG